MIVTNTHFYIRQELFAVVCAFALIGVGFVWTLAKAMWKEEKVIQLTYYKIKANN